MISRYKANGDNAAFFQELAEVVWKAHHRYWWFYITKEDAIQVALIRCRAASEYYDPTRMAPNSYFSMIIRQEISRVNGKDKRWLKTNISIETMMKATVVYTVNWANFLISCEPGPDTSLDVAETVERVREAVRGLPTGQRKVVEAVLAGETVSEIARGRGVSVAAVSKTYRTALHNLKVRRYRTLDLTECV